MGLFSPFANAARAAGFRLPWDTNAPPPVVSLSPEVQVFNAWADGQFVRSMAEFVADQTDSDFTAALNHLRAVTGTPHIAASFPETWRRTALLLGIPANLAAPTVH